MTPAQRKRVVDTFRLVVDLLDGAEHDLKELVHDLPLLDQGTYGWMSQRLRALDSLRSDFDIAANAIEETGNGRRG